MADRSSFPKSFLSVAALAVIVGCSLRMYSAMGDFWLDEIWSLTIALQATSLVDLLHFKVDNNHLLNTMLMRLMGEQAYWPLYRVPSIMAGGVSIVLAGLLARRWSNAAAIIAMIVFAVSHPLVHYGSEARGYSLAVMFMLGAMLSLQIAVASSASENRSSRRIAIIAYWLCCGLGMMSHPLFVQPFLALIAWFAFRTIAQRTFPARGRTLQLVSSHVPPLLFALLLFFAHWRGMAIAGGAIESPFLIATQAAALAIGAPRDPFGFTIAAALLATAAFFASMIWHWRRDRGFAIFALLATIIVPAIMIVLLRPNVVYERYFLLPIVVALLSISIWMGDLFQHGGTRRVIAIAAILAFISLNCWRNVDLIQRGRGHYFEALEFIAANTDSPEIVIGSDHEFRNRTTIEFYARYLDRPVRYIPEAAWPSPDSEWFILHALDQERQPQARVTDRAGVRWELVASYGCSELSGFRWFVYRRISP